VLAIGDHNKAKPRVCFLLCVHTEMWSGFSSLSQGDIKEEKDNIIFFLFVAEELEGLAQKDGR